MQHLLAEKPRITFGCNVSGCKVIFTRLSHSKTLTHLPVLSIAVKLVAMAAE